MNLPATLQMTTFVASPLPDEFSRRIRQTLRDDFNRHLTISVAKGGEPLRDQLRRASAGERIILCSYQAVSLPSPFAAIGPIFISAEPVSPSAFWPDELPPGYFLQTLALRAYDKQDCITDSTVCEPAAAPEMIREFLGRADVTHLHASFAGHGCFACRFDRSPGT